MDSPFKIMYSGYSRLENKQMRRSIEFVKPIAIACFEQGLTKDRTALILKGYVNNSIVAAWRKEWGQQQSSSQQNAAA